MKCRKCREQTNQTNSRRERVTTHDMPSAAPPRGYDTFGRSAKRESSTFAHQNATLVKGLYSMAFKYLKLFINSKSSPLPFLAPLLALALTSCISASGEIL